MTFNIRYTPSTANINGSQSLLGQWKARREAMEKANLQSRPPKLRSELLFKAKENGNG